MAKFLDQLKYKLEEYLDLYEFKMIVIGHDVEFSFQNDYFYSHYYENFLKINQDDCDGCHLLLIVGDPNWNQLNSIKKIYDTIDPAKRKVFYIKSGLDKSALGKSYFLCHDLSEHIKVDVVYDEYPYNFRKINNLLINCVRAS